ncbi:MAG: ribonuclease P protein component [Bacteroidota bacterium]
MNSTGPKIKRLKSKILIKRLFEEGKNIRVGAFQLLYIQDENNVGFQVGVGASKRKLTKAVNRNKAKRIMREVLRLEFESFVCKDEAAFSKMALMLIYHGNRSPDFAVARQKINTILERFKYQIEEDE